MSLLQQLEKLTDLCNQASELSTIEEINIKKCSLQKGKISDVMKTFVISAEEKPLIGKKVNELKQKYLSSFDEKIKILKIMH